MTLAPLLAASPVIQAHVAFAVAALVSGAAIAVMPKGTARHRLLGRFAALMMLLTALTSFGIYRDGLSVIHILSVVTIASLASGIYAIRHRSRRGHQRAMLGAWAGLVGAALFTLLPGRIMGRVFFGG